MKQIENIFSKKSTSKKEHPPVEIIIDFREKNSLLPSILSNKNMKIKFDKLEIGDYLIGNIAIERKTLNDLQASIFDKRIFSQLDEIKKYPSYFLLIEEYDAQSKFLKKNSLRGLILSLISEHRIPIIFSENPQESAEYLILLAKKLSENKKRFFSERPKKNTKSKKELQKFILEGFPGIGPSISEKMIEEYKSLKAIFNQDEQSLSRLLGLKSKQFIELLN